MTLPLSRPSKGTFGTGSAAAARSAAIFGPASAASLDHPAVSRILAYLVALARPAPAAASENRAASCVHPTVSGAVSPASARNRSSSERQSCRAVVTCSPRQPRRTASASIGIVSSHEQTRTLPRELGILRLLSLQSKFFLRRWAGGRPSSAPAQLILSASPRAAPTGRPGARLRADPLARGRDVPSPS